MEPLQEMPIGCIWCFFCFTSSFTRTCSTLWKTLENQGQNPFSSMSKTKIKSLRPQGCTNSSTSVGWPGWGDVLRLSNWSVSSIDSTLFNFIQLYSTLFNFIQLYSTLFNFIQLYSTLFNFIQLINADNKVKKNSTSVNYSLAEFQAWQGLSDLRMWHSKHSNQRHWLDMARVVSWLPDLFISCHTFQIQKVRALKKPTLLSASTVSR